MSAPLARPMRALRYELYALAAVISVPLSLAFAFPYEAVSFRPSEEKRAPRASCAFVTLTPEEEADILAEARAAWKVSAAGVRRLRADLSLSELPDESAAAVARMEDRARALPPKPVKYDVAPLPPSLAAPPPRKIAADPADGAEEALAFPRRELLTID